MTNKGKEERSDEVFRPKSASGLFSKAYYLADLYFGVEAAPLHLASHHWREVDPLGYYRSDAKRAAEIRGCPPPLRASYSRKGTGRKGEKEKLSLL